MHARSRHGRTLDLPPPFRPKVLRELGDAFTHARGHAAELGAGGFVFVGRFDVAEFAVVLEPEEPLAAARRVFYAGMVAIADTLAALAPPETRIVIDWPDALYAGRGLVGGGRLVWPEEAEEAAVPEWLVFGATLRIVSLGRKNAVQHPLSAGLVEQGFDEISAERLAAGFARHLMVAIDDWQERGFAPIAEQFVAKLRPENGAHRQLDDNGDFRIRCAGRPVEHRKLLPALRAPSWHNPVR